MRDTALSRAFRNGVRRARTADLLIAKRDALKHG
jgi:hypothetical protein